MKIIRNIITFCVIVIVGILASEITYSFWYTANIQITPPTYILPGSLSSTTAGDFIGAIVAWMIQLTAVLTVLAITWSGIQMIVGIGEEEKMKKARHTMIYAFIGLIVAGLAYALVTLVTSFNLDNFL